MLWTIFFCGKKTLDLMLRRKNKMYCKEISYLLWWQTKCDRAPTIRKSHYLRQLARESQEDSFKMLQKGALVSMGMHLNIWQNVCCCPVKCIGMVNKMWRRPKKQAHCYWMKFRETIPREMKRICNSEGRKEKKNKIARAAVMFASKCQINYYKT